MPYHAYLHIYCICTSGRSLVGVDTIRFSNFQRAIFGKPCMFLGFIVSLLVGTIGILYKEASHTSYIWFEWPPRARVPGQPMPR